MALTNQSTQMNIQISEATNLNDIVRALREEVKQASDISAATKKEYERRAKILENGWDMEKAGKRERYLMRAAGIWHMRNLIRKNLNEADRIRKRGTGTREEIEKQQVYLIAKATKIAQKLDRFREHSWSDCEKRLRQQADHKKKAAKDTDLHKFFTSVGSSQFRPAFLVAEFTGCRGEELGKGIRIEVKKINGIGVLHFYIESAKSDGKKKGLDLREIVVPFPEKATKEVKQRWIELAKYVGKGSVVKVEATEKQTAGQRFTQNFRCFATKAGVEISAYSLRHRVSAQVKEAGNAENTAAVLGHQTTETQRHYARKHHKGISPSAIVGINKSGAQIRGCKSRTGPTASVIKNSVAAAPLNATVATRRMRL